MAQIPRGRRSRQTQHGQNSLSPEPLRGSPTPDSEFTPLDVRSTPTPDRPASGFNKMRAARNSQTPVTPSSRTDRRFWPRDTRGLLEICEQGYQLQQGMKSHCKETADAMECLTENCESTVKFMHAQMEETVRMIQSEFAKPANVDWTPMMDHLQRLQPEVVDSVVMDHQESIQRLEGELSLRIDKGLEELQNTQQRVEEVQNNELQEIRKELQEVIMGSAAVEELVKSSQVRFERLFDEQSQAWHNTGLQETLLEMRGMQEDVAKRVANIEPLIEVKLASSVSDTSLGGQSNALVKDIHDTVHGDLMSLFHEVGLIQRELNIDYLENPKNKAKRRDTVPRLRDMWAQTELQQHDAGTQVDESLLKKGRKRRAGSKEKTGGLSAMAMPSKVLAKEAGQAPKKQIFADEEAMKAKMRAQLIKPEYNVFDFYHSTGCAQAVAKSAMFENITFLVILLNAAWLAVDTDHNDAATLNDADLVFQISEHTFCTYFFLELLTRFLAFKRKRNCVKDFWFLFDSLLVFGMIVETWIITLVVAAFQSGSMDGSLGKLSILRIAKLAKMFRMARMARLLRMVPELVVLIKGIGAALRSVGFFILLSLIIIYVFAVFFRQITKDTDAESQYFSSVPDAMNSLLLHAMLPMYGTIVNDLAAAHPLLWPAIMTFILLASITVLNMLLGVLVEVVRTVAATEKEAMTVTAVTQQLKEVMDVFQGSGLQWTRSTRGSLKEVTGMRHSIAMAMRSDKVLSEENEAATGNLSRSDFDKFLMEPEVGMIISEVGVDVVGLIDMADMIFEDKDKEGLGLSFADFVDVVLNMRGTNPSTVKDVKQQVRIIKTALRETSESLRAKFAEELDILRMDVMEQLLEIKKRQRQESDDEYEETDFGAVQGSASIGSKPLSRGSQSQLSRSDDGIP